MADVPRWSVVEIELAGQVEHSRLPDGTGPTIRLISPSGRDHRVEAFWDGGRRWLARSAPARSGAGAGAPGVTPTRCTPPPGVRVRGADCHRPLSHGPLRVAADRRHLNTDGTLLLARRHRVERRPALHRPRLARVLSIRREQGFTSVQFVTTQWRGWPLAEVFVDAEELDEYRGISTS